MLPLGETPVLAAAALNWCNFGAGSNTFPRSRDLGHPIYYSLGTNPPGKASRSAGRSFVLEPIY